MEFYAKSHGRSSTSQKRQIDAKRFRRQPLLFLRSCSALACALLVFSSDFATIQGPVQHTAHAYTGGISDRNKSLKTELERAMLANYGKLNLECALDSYHQGRPVIVKATDGGVLHGEQTLKAIVEIGISLDCAVINGVDRNEFESTDWPEVLEAARVVFMQNGFLP